MKKYESLLIQLEKDKSSGSIDIAHKACNIFLTFADEMDECSEKNIYNELLKISTRIINTQPDMALIYNLVFGCIESFGKNGTTKDIVNYIDNFINSLNNSLNLITNHAVKIIKRAPTIGTISYSGSVKHFIMEYSKHNDSFQVIISESSPGDEGIHLAHELQLKNINLLLIPDSCWFIYGERCDAFVVGADAITEEFFINKAGSSVLALVARAFRRPFYVLGSKLKIMPKQVFQQGRVKRLTNEEWNPKIDDSIPYEAPMFERVPLELVTRIIAEDGMLTREMIMKKASMLSNLVELLKNI